MTEERRRRVPRRIREQQIIDVAVRVFSKRGYHAASVDEIAELAGISKPMVYLYLESKEGLFIACLRREADRLVRAFQDAAREAGRPDERLHAGLRAFFAFVAEHRDGWVVLYRQASELSESIAREVALARRAVLSQVAGLVRDGVREEGGDGRVQLREEDADFVAYSLVGAADSLTDWTERHPGQSPDGVALRLMNMVWVGMERVLRGETWSPEHG
ncbi:TetR/AcrR family transcriptional regulator [Streptomyces alkaliterrae]|uniref:TetR family transcriptional regulator n=1 Tax=Streptomyces alkaliterrae TaxID=2213162 RepID=A0A5P0YSZ1_9ACTN|nr:TetR/AcrR family transcriptional regulator [Streptomyces alkaliterrae]MBB1255072.1 TetR/AcrR family transcriptional regulator [Streptomyces alkaliterrae]MBB1258255.1 TetR/AcrR family transcriptional regulator [Streptomyces alkaliterrae]MQS03398.1 TetR family transcriptional regulator [Streptomyces alkaliterrae]